MGQLVARAGDVTTCSSGCTHNAIWIPVAVVWQRGDAVTGIGSGQAIAPGVAAGAEGPQQRVFGYP